MDFTFTPEQDEAAELAARILGDRATNERMKTVEAAGDRFDRDLWAELGSAGLLGLALPEEYDGAGLGLIELCRVLVEVGRTVAPVPLAAHGPASRLVAELGTDEQKQQWLPGAAAGARVLTAAVAEERAFAPERADDRGRARRRRLPAHRQQGDRPGRHRADAVPGARRDADRRRRVPGRSPATTGVTVDRPAVLRRRRASPGSTSTACRGRRPAAR